MKFFCLLLSILIVVSSHAQTENDASARQAQPVLVESLLREATQLLKNEQFQEAYRKARQARGLSQRRGYKAREARATNLMALAAMSGGRVKEAIALFKEASALSSESGPDEVRQIQVMALDRAGRLSRIIGRYEDALWCFNQALQLHRQRKNHAGEVLMLSNLSAVYADTGDFTKAAQTLQEALPLVRREGDRFLEKSLLTRFLIVEKGRGNFTAALQYGEQALALEPRRPNDPNNKQPLLLLSPESEPFEPGGSGVRSVK